MVLIFSLALKEFADNKKVNPVYDLDFSTLNVLKFNLYSTFDFPSRRKY